MNTNSNTYTVVYSIILVVVVAAVLAFTAVTLKPQQETNIKVETISKILTAAGLYSSEQEFTNQQIMQCYSDNISEAVVINAEGDVVDRMSTDVSKITIKNQSDLKAQYDIMKKVLAGDAKAKEKLEIPVYIFNVDGKRLQIVPCYGAGLWGPIWGYLAFEEDMNTVSGAVFDHKGETPGLGAEIATEDFRSHFAGKQITDRNGRFTSIKVMKGGAPEDDINGVDAISGGTITSQALEITMKTWLEFYLPYFNKNMEE